MSSSVEFAVNTNPVSQDRQAPPALLTKKLIVKFFVPVGERTLDHWISAGTFPRPDIAIGGKTRFWRRETIQRWIDENAQNTH